MGQRVVFTGGSGKAGRYVIPELLKKGHQILNLDVAPLDQPGVFTLKTDLTQPGQAFNALLSQFVLVAPNPPGPVPVPDAVIHFAGMARNMLCTDDETFRINALATYNIVDAACKLGVKKIVLASSGCVYGVTFASGDIDYDSFPIDEELDVNPMDTYAISKMCIERIARGFARRYDVDIYCLRIGTVIAPHEYAEPSFQSYVNEPELHKASLWSYTDARDLGQMCNLALEKSGLGFQIFNATNDSITHRNSTTEFLKKHCPNTQFTREMGEFEAPQSNAKMKKLLGFKEEHHWEMYSPLVKETPEKEDVAEVKDSVVEAPAVEAQSVENPAVENLPVQASAEEASVEEAVAVETQTVQAQAVEVRDESVPEVRPSQVESSKQLPVVAILAVDPLPVDER